MPQKRHKRSIGIIPLFINKGIIPIDRACEVSKPKDVNFIFIDRTGNDFYA